MCRSLLPLVALAAVAACATTPEPRETSAYQLAAQHDVAPPPAAAQPQPPVQDERAFDAIGTAAHYPRETECEPAARALQSRNRDNAWALLKACIERGNFTSLKLIVQPAWEADLRSRPDAAALLTRIIAQRGCDVEGDLRMLQKRKIPLFTLGAAVSQPETFKGRFLIVRARIADLKSAGGKPTVSLAEVSLGTKGEDVQVGVAYESSYRDSGTFNARVKSSDFGNTRVDASRDSTSSTRNTVTERRYDNVAQETGLEALGRLIKPDPFLEKGKQFIMLVRFDGVRKTGNSDEDSEAGPLVTAVVTIAAYFEPSAFIID